MAWRDLNTASVKASHLLGAAALSGVVGLALWIRKQRKVGPANIPNTPESGDPNDEIVLIGYPRSSDLASSISPYDAKVAAWLRFVDLPYTKKFGAPQKAPKGQLPIIQHGPNTVPDSVFIIKYLQRTYPNVGTELSQEDEAKAIVIQHFVDKHLVPGLGWNRWIHHKGWEGVSKQLLQEAPQPMRWILLNLFIRPSIQTGLFCQGMARHSEGDVMEVMDEGFAALSALLGDKKFLLGSEPCIADASAFGFLDNVLHDHACVNPALRKLAQQYSNLVVYVDSIRNSYFARDLAWEETSA